MTLKAGEVRAYLLANGVTKAQYNKAEGRGLSGLQELAESVNCTLKDEETVRMAVTAARAEKKATTSEAALTPLTAEERKRFAAAFEHFDKDKSGELDVKEFRSAMLDSGMCPYPYEQEELFKTADMDGSGTITFEEYCHFIQVYRAKQSWWERMMESMTDKFMPKPSYLTKTAASAAELH